MPINIILFVSYAILSQMFKLLWALLFLWVIVLYPFAPLVAAALITLIVAKNFRAIATLILRKE